MYIKSTIYILVACCTIINVLYAMEELEGITVEKDLDNVLWKYVCSLDEYDIEDKPAFDKACKPFFEQIIVDWGKENAERYNDILKNLSSNKISKKYKLDKNDKKILRELRLQARIARWKAQEQRYRVRGLILKRRTYLVIATILSTVMGIITTITGYTKKCSNFAVSNSTV